MATLAQTYFSEQIAPQLDGEVVTACGYFRSKYEPNESVLEQVPGGQLLSFAKMFSAAAKARGTFIALTEHSIIMVVTRASATKTPLRENLGVLRIPVATLRAIVEPDHISLKFAGGALRLEPWLEHPVFPQQGALVEALSQRFGSGLTLAELRKAKRRGLARGLAINLGLVAIAVVVLVVFK